MDLLTKVLKWILFALNILFLICGILFITYGAIIVATEHRGIDSFTDFSVGGFAIAVGILIFLISFLGCWGTYTENGCFLLTYASVLIVILIIQIVLGGLALSIIYGNEDTLNRKTQNIVGRIFDDYVSSPTDQKRDLIDRIQRGFKCCGVFNSGYWTVEHTPFGLPASCCANDDCTNGTYQMGCASAFKDSITSNIAVIGGVAIGFGVIEIFGVVAAILVRKYTEFNLRL